MSKSKTSCILNKFPGRAMCKKHVCLWAIEACVTVGGQRSYDIVFFYGLQKRFVVFRNPRLQSYWWFFPEHDSTVYLQVDIVLLNSCWSSSRAASLEEHMGRGVIGYVGPPCQQSPFSFLARACSRVRRWLCYKKTCIMRTFNWPIQISEQTIT